MPGLDDAVYIPTSNLVPGLFVDLELGWMEHPFPLSRFRIRTAREIATIRQLKPDRVKVRPGRSDPALDIAAIARQPVASPAAAHAANTSVAAALAGKKAEQEQFADLRARRLQANAAYRQRSEQIRRLTADMKMNPANALADIDTLAESLASVFDADGGMLTQLVELSSTEYSDAQHVTNVVMLSLMLGAASGLKGTALRRLGTGAMLHDIGYVNVPAALRRKHPRSPAEERIVAQHARYGRVLADRIRALPDTVLDIIELHHEYLDGSGHPHGRRGDAIPLPVRIVSIADQYDYLCNPPDSAQRITPKCALATLYRDYRDRLDHGLIERLVDLVGIYPPGSVVALDGDEIALVLAARAGDRLRPEVLVYHAEVPKREAVILRLADHPEMNIVGALLPGEYPPEIHDYFSIQERLGYLLGTEEG